MKALMQSLLVTLVLLGSIHQSFAPIGLGNLVVTIDPTSAVTAGAKWQVDGAGPFYSSGTTNQFGAGSHTVAFTTVYGWASPASVLVTVGLGQNAITNGIYLLTNSPSLVMNHISNNKVKIAWPSAWTNWGLVQNSNLIFTNWVTATATITDDGTNKSVILTNTAAGNNFFRLKL